MTSSEISLPALVQWKLWLDARLLTSHVVQIVSMAPRSQLEIATSSVERLVKEEASYHRELQQQTERIQKLESQEAGEDENREYMLKQEVGFTRLKTFPRF
jgi:hypothetical protein